MKVMVKTMEGWYTLRKLRGPGDEIRNKVKAGIVALFLLSVMFIVAISSGPASAWVPGSSPIEIRDDFEYGYDGWEFPEGSGGMSPGGPPGSNWYLHLFANTRVLLKTGDDGRSDLDISCDLKTFGQGQIIVLFYWDEANQEGYGFRLNTVNGGQSTFVKKDAAGWNNFGFAIPVGNPAPDTWYNVRIVITGHNFYCYLNGQLKAESDDVDYEYVTSHTSFDPRYVPDPLNRIGFKTGNNKGGVDNVRIFFNTIYDRFNHDLSKWETIGSPARSVSNSNWYLALHPNDGVTMNLGDFGLHDYVIEVDFNLDDDETLDVNFRMKDPQNKYCLRLSADDTILTQFHFHQFAVDTPFGENANIDVPHEGYHHLKLVVDGDFFIAYVDEVYVASGTHTTWKEGDVGFVSSGSASLDNYSISTKTIFDDFQHGTMDRWDPGEGTPSVAGTENKFLLLGDPIGFNPESATFNHYSIGHNSGEITCRVKLMGGVIDGNIFFGKLSNGEWYTFTLSGVGPCEFRYTTNGMGNEGSIGKNYGKIIVINNFHDVRIVFFNYKMYGYVDGELVAEAESDSAPPIMGGDIGAYNGQGTQMMVDDLYVRLDTDEDSSLDLDEIRGLYHKVDVLDLDYSEGVMYTFYLPEVGDYRAIFSAEFADGQIFTLNHPRPLLPDEIEDFDGYGHYAIYHWTDCDISIAAAQEYSFWFENWCAGEVSIDWFGFVKDDHSIHTGEIADADDYDPVFTDAGVTDRALTLLNRDQWEFPDFDGDQMSDYKEARVTYRTNVDFGVLTSENYRQLPGQNKWINFKGFEYEYTCGYSPDDEADPSLNSDLVFYLVDGSEVHRYPQDRSATEDEYLFIWSAGANQQPGTLNTVWQYTIDNANTFSPSSSDIMHLYQNGREALGHWDSSLTNERFALLLSPYSGLTMWNSAYWNNHYLREVLVDDLDYIDDDGAVGFDGKSEHICYLYETGGSVGSVPEEYVDGSGSKASISSVFTTLSNRMDEDDSLLISLEINSAYDDVNDIFYWDVFKNLGVSESMTATEFNGDGYLDEISASLQIVILISGSESGGSIAFLSDDDRVVEVSSRWNEKTWEPCDNKDRFGNPVLEYVDHPWMQKSAHTEQSYYIMAALKGETIRGDRISQSDYDGNRIISIQEMFNYATDQNSHYWLGLQVLGQWYWENPLLEDNDDGTGHQEPLPNNSDGYWSSTLYL